MLPPPPPPPPPHGTPLPSLTPEPHATARQLASETARAIARENEIAASISAAVEAAVSQAAATLATAAEEAIRDAQAAKESAEAAARDAAAAIATAGGVVAEAAEPVATAVARAAVSEALARYALKSDLRALGYTATTTQNGLLSAADKVKLDGDVIRTAQDVRDVFESLVQATVDALCLSFPTMNELRAAVADAKEYAGRVALKAARMTASTDGNSQIQVSNAGVPMLKRKTGNTLTHPWKTVVRYSTAPTVTYLGTNIQLPADLYFGWSNDYEATATSGYRVIARAEVGDDSYQIRDLKITYGENGAFSIAGKKVHVALHDTFPYQPYIAASEDFTLCTGSFGSANSGFTVEHYDTETYPEIVTCYLVTEATLGALEARIAALEALLEGSGES